MAIRQSGSKYLSQCMPSVDTHLALIEAATYNKLIPALLCNISEKPVQEDFYCLLDTFVRFGRIVICTPMASASRARMGFVRAGRQSAM